MAIVSVKQRNNISMKEEGNLSSQHHTLTPLGVAEEQHMSLTAAPAALAPYPRAAPPVRHLCRAPTPHSTRILVVPALNQNARTMRCSSITALHA